MSSVRPLSICACTQHSLLPGHSRVFAIQQVEALSRILLECCQTGELSCLREEKGSSIGGRGWQGGARGAQGSQLPSQRGARHLGSACSWWGRQIWDREKWIWKPGTNISRKQSSVNNKHILQPKGTFVPMQKLTLGSLIPYTQGVVIHSINGIHCASV